MALSKSEIALYAYATGRVLPKGTTRKAFRTAVRALTPVAARAAPAAATGIASAAAANPITAGALLGLGTLATPPGQALLDAAAVRGAADRIAAQQAVDEAIFRATELPARQLQSAVASPAFKPAVKRKVSKYSKAVKAGMKAVKNSKFIGKKGTINNAKSAFKSVNLVASAVNKGKKVSNKGVRGVIARAVRKIL
jgi:hypothetical protein